MRQVALATAYIGSRRAPETSPSNAIPESSQSNATPDRYERVSANEYDGELLDRFYHTALDEAKPWLRWHPSPDTLADFLTERVIWRWMLTVWPEDAPQHEQRSEDLLQQLKEQANLRRTRKLRRKMNPF